MPEGDTIASYARHLGPWLEGAVIRGVECRWPRVVHGLAGTTATRVWTVGKHLLVGFDDGTHLRVHLGMKGSWHRYDPEERWRRSREDLAVALRTDAHAIVCFGAPEVERIDDRALAGHPVLAALGPDLLVPDADLDAVLHRAAAAGHARLADLLLDQRVACGLGNVYKSELAFLFRLDPFCDPAAVPPETLRAVYARGGALLRENVGRERNTTGRRRPELWVYGRERRPCLRCGAPVARFLRDAADRATWWCAGCQPGTPR